MVRKVLQMYATMLTPTSSRKHPLLPKPGEKSTCSLFLKSQFLAGMSISGLSSFGKQWPFPRDGLIFWRQMNMSYSNPVMLPGEVGRGREFQQGLG
jgi:hypothetical protein